MTSKNSVFIATSIDGFIAAKDGGLEWLDMIPNPDGEGLGYTDFIKDVDAIVMGRVTYETVIGFGIDWPYTIPVYILSNNLTSIPDDIENVFIVNGPLAEVIQKINSDGHHKLYIDGGGTIQNFLKEDLIDDLIITTIPILLGGGYPLFGELVNEMKFEYVETKIHLKQLVQNHYRRIR